MEANKITKQEKNVLTRRKFIFQGVLALFFGGIALRLWSLQIVNGAYYKKLSEENSIRLVSAGGLRGLIYDQNNTIVAQNIPSYDLLISSRKLKDIKQILQKISFTLGIPYQSLLANFQLNLKTSNFENIKIFSGLTWKQVALIEAYQEEFPKVFIDVNQIRQYLFSDLLAHLLGYTNLINKKQLKTISSKKVKSATHVGSSGVEQQYNKDLLGADGKIRLEINSSNKIISTQYVQLPRKGSNIYLNVDARQQANIYKVFGGRKGAAIVMDPYQGKVLAMCSTPSFDPNRFSAFLSKKEWSVLFKSKEGFLNNRCIQGVYPPGSTFKMLVAIAALEEKIIDKEFIYNCVGYYKVNRKNYYCWKKSGHKEINLVEAISQSCNTFFYHLGLELGVDKIYEYAVSMGFNANTGIDIPNEKNGNIPNKQWKQKIKKSKWYLGETVGVSIGQNYVSVTPLQLITYVNAIVNGGNLIQPRVTDYIQTGSKISTIAVTKKKLDFQPKNLALVLEGMRNGVATKHGTSRGLKNAVFSAGGKTGTTQLISSQIKSKIIKEQGKLDLSLENHVWFTGFAPAYNPKYSIVVLLENGKQSSNAVAVAKNILYNYFS